MTDENRDLDNPWGMAQSGLWRLMLKLPKHRTRLRALSDSYSAGLDDLFHAYDEACLALETFRRSPDRHPLVEEYERVCAELEAEVVQELERRGREV